MAIEILTKSTSPNKSVDFNFANDVYAYIVGISYWSFTFGSSDHHIKRISLSLASNKPSSKTITTTVSGRMDDDSGHGLDSNSTVTVTCIAVTKSTNNNIVFGDVKAISSGSDSTAISVPSPQNIASAFLSGFDLSYGSSDHHVKTLEVTAGLSVSGNTAEITAEDLMKDDSGNDDSTATVDGAMVCTASSDSSLYAVSVSNKQTTSPFTVTFPVNITVAGALLQHLYVTYGGSDHHVRSIGGGTSSVTVSGKVVTLSNASAFMSDDSGNKQSASSYVNMIVFGA